MAVIFVLVIVLAIVAVAALVTYLLGLWSSAAGVEKSDPAPPVRHDSEHVTRGDPTPTNK